MIQLHQHTLLIYHDDGRIEPMDIQDLIRHLAGDPRIASKVLHPWVLERIVESIFYHFREELQRDRIVFSGLVNLIRSLLESFLLDVLPHENGQLRLDLFDVASRHGIGFELEFYNELKRFLFEKARNPRNSKRLSDHENEFTTPLRSMAEYEKQPILKITGLRSCSKYLSGRRRWSKSSSRVRDEILAYIRQEAARAGASDLVIAVLS